MKCSTAGATILALSGVTLAFPQPGLLDDVHEGCDPYDPQCQEAGPFLNHLIDSSKQFAELTQQDGLVNDDHLANAKYQLPIHSSADYNDGDMYDDLPYEASVTGPKSDGVPGHGIEEDNPYDDALYDNDYANLYSKDPPQKDSFEVLPKGLHRRAMLGPDSAVVSTVDGAISDVAVDQTPELAADYHDGNGVQYWDGSDNSTNEVNALTADPLNETLSFNATLTTIDSSNSTGASLINSTDHSAAGTQHDGASSFHFSIFAPLCSIILASAGAIFLL